MKKLYKSRKEKMFAGVCGGIAEYFDVDPVLVRILFVIFTFMGGSGVIAYIVGMIVMPFPPTETTSDAVEPSPSPPPASSSYSTPTDSGQTGQPHPTPSSNASGKGALIFGVILVLLGAYFLMRNIPLFQHWYWWIRWNVSDYFVPAIFIIIGAVLIGNSRKKKENES